MIERAVIDVLYLNLHKTFFLSAKWNKLLTINLKANFHKRKEQ